MVLSISVTPTTENRLREMAAAAGRASVNDYVAELIEHAAAKSSLDEILAPLRKQFAESGTTDESLVDEITAAQSEYRTGRRVS